MAALAATPEALCSSSKYVGRSSIWSAGRRWCLMWWCICQEQLLTHARRHFGATHFADLLTALATEYAMWGWKQKWEFQIFVGSRRAVFGRGRKFSNLSSAQTANSASTASGIKSYRPILSVWPLSLAFWELCALCSPLRVHACACWILATPSWLWRVISFRLAFSYWKGFLLAYIGPDSPVFSCSPARSVFWSKFLLVAACYVFWLLIKMICKIFNTHQNGCWL